MGVWFASWLGATRHFDEHGVSQSSSRTDIPINESFVNSQAKGTKKPAPKLELSRHLKGRWDGAGIPILRLPYLRFA